MNNGIFIIYGATGDLNKRKLIPALYTLFREHKINEWFFVGAAIDETSIDTVLENARAFCQHVEETSWNHFKKHWYYQRLDFNQAHEYAALATLVQTIENQQQLSGNRLLYVATAATFFCTITNASVTHQLIVRNNNTQTPWQRIVFEKPFGHDLASAQQINQCIQAALFEHQAYRVDHFLSKELVSNIALIRFTNAVFEPLWNFRYIDQVQIVLNESIGIEGRGRYYDDYGALADVVQNHMLELLALVGMESPEKLVGKYIRTAREQVLSRVQVVDGMFGQYEGYRQEEWVKPDSMTETFAMLFLRVNTPRWQGVPFYLKTGKCLKAKETVIHIKFKQVDCLLLRNCPVPSNWLSITISSPAQTDTGVNNTSFSISLNAKKPGTSDELVPIAMEFCHSCYFGTQDQGAYELLVQDIIRGEQSVAVGQAEIEFAWNIIDKVRVSHFPLYQYACGSSGPSEITLFEQKHGMRWRS